MPRIYFLANALLYVIIALKTSLNPDKAADSVGLLFDSTNGRSEYVSSNIGLPLGLAGIFLYFAYKSEATPAGLMVGILLYSPIVVSRCLPALMAKHRYALLAGPTAIEVLLLLIPLALLTLHLK